MQFKPNSNQIEYVLYHLNHHFELIPEIKKKIIFDRKPEEKPGIIFHLSDKKLDKIKYIDEIPILFPISDKRDFYYFDKDNNLIFNDDLIKSSFYLLSGYQETERYTPDKYDRFPYRESIQFRLKTANKPIVNYYFKIISEGIEEFCRRNNIPFNRRKLWGNSQFGFLLTHDVDRVDKYTFAQVKLKIKQLAGISPAKLKRPTLLKYLFTYTIKMFGKENPFWNFDWLKSIEQELGFKSVWFFLPQDDPKKDAYFSFKEERIKNLVKKLKESGDEIGLHSTFNSYKNEKILSKNFFDVKELLGEEPLGNRQHWLRFKYPDTLRQLEKIGIKYDSTWGFHDQVGWRNSYCMPFRPYDIEQDRMMNIWEFPLTVMDTTLFEYQTLDFTNTMKEIDQLLIEMKNFGGLFILLWHNNNFDEIINSGITDFYIKLLKAISKMNAFNFQPGNLIDKLRTYES